MSNSFEKEIMDSIPNELWQVIFSFLDPYSLLNVALVSKYFNYLSNSEFLWSDLCKQLFKGKHIHFIMKTAPNPGNKKNLYFFALRDSKRNQITKEEVVASLWLFRFRQQSYSMYMRFLEDGTIDTRGIFNIDRNFEWLWYIFNNNTVLAVNNYPECRFQRTTDWGWAMSNEWVYYYTVSMTGEYNITNEDNITEEDISSGSSYYEKRRKMLKNAETEKDLGNELFHQEKIFEAKFHYHMGLYSLLNGENAELFFRRVGQEETERRDHLNTIDPEQNGRKIRELCCFLLSNLSACWIKDNNYHEGLHFALNAEYFAKVDPSIKNPKVIYRVAFCYYQLGKKKNALQVLKDHLQLDPTLKQLYDKISADNSSIPVLIPYDAGTLRTTIGNLIYPPRQKQQTNENK